MSMLGAPLDHLQAGAAAALGVLTLRALPTLVAFFVSGACSGRQKVAALIGYQGIAYLAIEYSDFAPLELILVYAYLLGASLVSYFAAPRMPRAAVFLLALAVFFVVPGIWLHEHVLVLLLGWELALASYSYFEKAPQTSRRLEDYWFFLFVNPTLAYPARGTYVGSPGLHAPALLRTAQGAVALVLSGVIFSIGSRLTTTGASLAAAGQIAVAGLRLAGLYAAHWGLASVQIGLFRQLGYAAPERYLTPYRATSPRDFWGRWNTYLGSWVRFHVFEPLVRLMRPLSKTWRARGRLLVRGIAVMASFLAIGALHDLYAMTVRRELSASMTLWFAVNALILLAWDAVASWTPARRRRWLARMAAPVAMLGLVAVLATTLP